MKTMMMWGVFGLIGVIEAMAGDLEIIGIDRQSGIQFKGAAQSNYYMLEFASQVQGPWTNWGAVSEMAITGEVMATTFPMYFRVREVMAGEFPIYATGTPVYVENDPIWDAEKADYYMRGEADSKFATGMPLYVYNESDPVYQVEKARYATGTPVYAESDPVWSAQKANYATGMPLYAFTESDPNYQSEKSRYATGSPVYAESDPVYSSEKSRYATGTPLYIFTEADPIYASEKSRYATGMPIYTETDPVWTSTEAEYLKTDGSRAMSGQLDLAGNRITNATYFGDGSGLTNIPTSSITESDPIYLAEKSRYATGTPVYTESDPVWSSQKGNYATGTPIYAESDPKWASSSNFYYLKAQSDALFATGTPVYAENDPVYASEKSRYATGSPLYVYNETDPIYQAEKSRFATGTPVYAESDPVWSAQKGNYATGMPIYAESDPKWASSSNFYYLKAQSDALFATGTPVYAENDPVYASEKSRYATGTPLYVYNESDPVYQAEKSRFATGTPVYAESDPLWSAADSGYIKRDGSRSMTANLNLGGYSIVNVASNSITFNDGTALNASGVKNWNTAYGWGNHASAGYVTNNSPYYTPGTGIIFPDNTTQTTAYIANGPFSELNVSQFQATPGDGSIVLTWFNSLAPSFSHVLLLRNSNNIPATTIDGSNIYQGVATTYTDQPLTNGVEYFYKAFGFDTNANNSAGAIASAIPLASPRTITEIFSDTNGQYNLVDLVRTTAAYDNSVMRFLPASLGPSNAATVQVIAGGSDTGYQLMKSFNVSGLVEKVSNAIRDNWGGTAMTYCYVNFRYIDGTTANSAIETNNTTSFISKTYINPQYGKIVTNISIYLRATLPGSSPAAGYECNTLIPLIYTRRMVVVGTSSSDITSFAKLNISAMREIDDRIEWQLTDNIKTNSFADFDTRYALTNGLNTPTRVNLIVSPSTNGPSPGGTAIISIELQLWKQ